MDSDSFLGIYNSFTGMNFTIFGDGLDYYQGHDFLSIYMPSIGIIGIFILLLFMKSFSCILKNYKGLSIIISLFLLNNGSLMEVPYQCLIFIIYFFNPKSIVKNAFNKNLHFLRRI
jgi:hypothetical protein